ncbi:hypothetical protein NL676_033987 [Syzygium grande]|nr:hypothetical protein NL676_033987 [Syzygium grande]
MARHEEKERCRNVTSVNRFHLLLHRHLPIGSCNLLDSSPRRRRGGGGGREISFFPGVPGGALGLGSCLGSRGVFDLEVVMFR